MPNSVFLNLAKIVLTLGMMIAPTSAYVESSYFSTLLPNGTTYVPPNNSSDDYIYQAIEVTLSVNGSYNLTIASLFDAYGYLYNNSFNPFSPLTNLIPFDDDSSGSGQFRIDHYLQSGYTYIFVITARNVNVSGNFSINVRGSAPVSMRLLPQKTTIYPINLSADSPIFIRPGGDPDEQYIYEAIPMVINTTGTYHLTSISSFDSYGYLYENSFDPLDPSENLITTSDDSTGNEQFQISRSLLSGRTYILVVTTFSIYTTGDFLLRVTGPAPVYIKEFTSTTVTPTITTTTRPTTSQYGIVSTYSNSLDAYSESFVRPYGNSGSCYYQAIETTTNTSGNYTFTSSSLMDTYGYLYGFSFDPAYPSRNLITSDDDSGGTSQFRISNYLQSGRKYILVFTTLAAGRTGSFTLRVTGPASVYMKKSTPTITITTTTPTSQYDTLSTYSNNLNWNSDSFTRPSGASTNYYYQAIRTTTNTSGDYIFTSSSSMDTYGYLYELSFDPAYPSLNLIASDDDSGGQTQFRIANYLQSGRTYILVFTTLSSSTTGSFTLRVSGPASVSMLKFTPITTITTTPTASQYGVASTYSSNLNANSDSFTRYGGSSINYYYQAIETTTNTSGNYILTSNSSFDTYGYLYEISFDPSYPSRNLIVYNDDGAGFSQFRIANYLQSGRKYILVFTTHTADRTGSFTIRVSGPASVSMLKFTPIRSITTTTTTTSTTSQYGVASTYSNYLDWDSGSFTRPGGSSSNYFYQAIETTTYTSGNYIFKSSSSFDTIGYLYELSFDPSYPSLNLLGSNDDGAGGGQFEISRYLTSWRKYILVVTTHSTSTTGNFVIRGNGPASVHMTRYIPTAAITTTTRSTTSQYGIVTTYSNDLNANSDNFTRLGGAGVYYHYDAIEMVTHSSGTYIFTSSSLMDTFGYLYEFSFDPAYPSRNLITSDDDSGDQDQFRISNYLQSGRKYILVFTTLAAGRTGSFTLRVTGPASVDILKLTPTTTTIITGTITTTTPSNYFPIDFRLLNILIIVGICLVCLVLCAILVCFFICLKNRRAGYRTVTTSNDNERIQAQTFAMNNIYRNMPHAANTAAVPTAPFLVCEERPAYYNPYIQPPTYSTMRKN